MITRMKTIAATTALAAAVLASPASAVTCTVASTGNSGADFSISPADALVVGPISGDPNPSCIAGNDDGANGFFDDGTLWGITSWTLSDKNESGTYAGPLSFDPAPINGATSGNWGITGGFLTTTVLVLKGGDGFAAFLLDGDPLSGTWSSNKTLSHASIWVSGDPVNPSPVPLPAAGWLLLMGLGGLGVASRRRRKALHS